MWRERERVKIYLKGKRNKNGITRGEERRGEEQEAERPRVEGGASIRGGRGAGVIFSLISSVVRIMFNNKEEMERNRRQCRKAIGRTAGGGAG